MNNTGLDIVLPCYNPLPGWEDRVIQNYHRLQSLLSDTQIRIILVNDGSSTGISADSYEKLVADISEMEWVDVDENQGKGHALREGIAKSVQPYCIFTDIDFPYTDHSLLSIYESLKEDLNDVAIGIKSKGYYTKLPPFRVKVSRFLRWLARNFLRISITDTQCGLKGFNNRGREIFLKTSINRYLADLEFIYLVDRHSQLKMKPIEVQLREGVEFSSVNVKILLKEGVNFLKVWRRNLFNT